jgi:hypothetical protein
VISLFANLIAFEGDKGKYNLIGWSSLSNLFSELKIVYSLRDDRFGALAVIADI